MRHDEMMQELAQRQQFFDQFCAAWGAEYRQRGGLLHCGKGCSGCCSLVVNCSLPEALRVAAAVDEQQLQRLRKHVVRLTDITAKAVSLKEWLAGYRRDSGGCPFLNPDGSCSVYLVRPLSCRSLLSTREPVWCTVDFSELSSQQKQVYMEALDQSAVAFPTHYAATPQELGQELESTTLRQMEDAYGFSIVGCLPWLVWLELEHGLSGWLADGGDSVKARMEEQGLLNQFLAVLL